MDYSPPSSSVCGDSPGKNTGLGCCPLPEDLPNPGIKPRSPTLQADSLLSQPLGKPLCVYMCVYICICVCWLLSCVQLWDIINCSPQCSSVNGILQTRILGWVAFPFSRGSSWPKDSYIAGSPAWQAGSLLSHQGSPINKFVYRYRYRWASLVTQLVKNPPAMRKTWVWSLGWEDTLEKGKATHSSILAWRILWTV